MNKTEIYKKILEQAQSDPNVIGFVLWGGRGKGQATEHSDYDILILCNAGAKEQIEEEYSKKYNVKESIDIHVKTVDEFRTFGNWGTSESWQAYSFAHVKAQIDKTGEIQKILDEKGRIPGEAMKPTIEGWLDDFINQYYRAFKNNRDGNILASHMDAVESIPVLLNVVFGREGRVRPYNKFLKWELSNYPLQHLPWSSEVFIDAINKVMQDGDIEIMKEWWRKIRDTSLEMGHEEAIRGWDGYVLE